MKVSELLNVNFIISELKGNEKEEAINELIDLFKNDARVIDIERVRTAVLEREKLAYRCWEGFAIPQAKQMQSMIY
jgi:mannitol/fructose-specific phosphotransferase system IIA component (Ntr-type)